MRSSSRMFWNSQYRHSFYWHFLPFSKKRLNNFYHGIASHKDVSQTEMTSDQTISLIGNLRIVRSIYVVQKNFWESVQWSESLSDQRSTLCQTVCSEKHSAAHLSSQIWASKACKPNQSMFRAMKKKTKKLVCFHVSQGLKKHVAFCIDVLCKNLKTQYTKKKSSLQVSKPRAFNAELNYCISKNWCLFW